MLFRPSRSWLFVSISSLLLLATIGFVALLSFVFYLEEKLPSVEHLAATPFQVPLRIYTADQKLIGEFGEKKRSPIAFNKVPPLLVACILATEDHRFYEHSGVDARGIFRAALRLLLHGTREQGGSTITMQVARNFYLSSEKTFLRKINEILLALKIEQNLNKEQILELYLNKIYFGKKAYGVVAAAQVYYGRPLDQLNLAQYAMIAGLPQAPSAINPVNNPEAAFKRRHHVLSKLLEQDLISREEFDQANAFPIKTTVHETPIESFAPHVAEMARLEAVARFGEEAYTEGYRVITTIDSSYQQAAVQSLRASLRDYDQRHGYRGPIQGTPLPFGDLLIGKVTALHPQTIEFTLNDAPGKPQVIAHADWSWARKSGRPADILKVGDSIYVSAHPSDTGSIRYRLSQRPQASAALVSIDPKSGRILSLMGGYEFQYSRFNRVTQAMRQPGSSFKAFIYAIALMDGFTAASIVHDAPLAIEQPGQPTWRPRNYSRDFYGPMRLRESLAKSRNLVTIRLLQAVGLDKALAILPEFGFQHLPYGLSLALGTGETTVLNMARGFAVFANGGYRVEPTFIDRIVNRDEQIVYQPDIPAPVRIIPENIAFLMNSLLQDVIRNGTGSRAKILNRVDIAGKTGSSQNHVDGWFVGYTPEIATAVWMGFDDTKTLKEYGSQSALPLWINYMEKVLPHLPERGWEPPADIVTAPIHAQTGLLALPGQKDSVMEYFTPETVPRRLSDPSFDSVQNPSEPPKNDPFLTPEESAILKAYESTEELF